MNKITFSFFCVIGITSSLLVQAKPCLMNTPMITGASVSAGLDGTSFGDQLAAKYGAQKNLIHEAYSGITGETIEGYRTFNDKIKNASIVLALDFFYWDQFTCNEADSEARIS